MHDNENDAAKAFMGAGWAFPVRPNMDGRDVGVVAYENDIRQAVILILETEPGERVMHPDFGGGLRSLVFMPLNTTTLALVRHRVEQALIMWEPRIDHINVLVERGSKQGQILIQVDYRVRTTNTFYNLVYPFYLQEGKP